MRQICFFLCMLVLTSCECFNVKKTTPEAILNEELKTFNWKEVDTYPSFSECDSLAGKEEKMYCFQYFLKKHISGKLLNETIVVNQDINDTINLQFQVSDKGVLSILNTDMDSVTIKEIPNINELLYKSLDSLPKIYPAIKRGQQVTTEFNLPIIINVN
ncbi:hypothetical protein L3X39_04740 [Sabulilitoribacter multivorans]|uniref:TonB protein C-terminal n=1 Tax=Flaviramulus multivorans TaxID=1304750 RepID=A0ABS9IGQ3_9FLAO|nr:hypothetical protein [Flaviramulus multivorans]MCF7559936.1 hypothetical protein [Flaviramulus multivorans]